MISENTLKNPPLEQNGLQLYQNPILQKQVPMFGEQNQIVANMRDRFVVTKMLNESQEEGAKLNNETLQTLQKNIAALAEENLQLKIRLATVESERQLELLTHLQTIEKMTETSKQLQLRLNEIIKKIDILEANLNHQPHFSILPTKRELHSRHFADDPSRAPVQITQDVFVKENDKIDKGNKGMGNFRNVSNDHEKNDCIIS